MSHSTRKVNLGNTCLAEVTIIDYVLGGESFTLAEFGLTGALVGVVFLSPSWPKQNLSATFSGGKVFLQYPLELGTELPSTTGINFTFVAIVHGT